MKLRLTLGVVVCTVATLAACTSAKTAKKDVTVTACKPGTNGGHPTADGRILNHSSKPSLYTIHVKFEDSAGNGVGDGVSTVAKVEPGATAKWHATGSLAAKGPMKCKVSSVTRNAVP